MNNMTPNSSNHSPESQAPRMLIERDALLARADVIIDLAADSTPADRTYREYLQPSAPAHPAVPAAVEQMMQRTTFVEQPRTIIGQTPAETLPYQPPAGTQVSGTETVAHRTIPTFQLPTDADSIARMNEAREQIDAL